MQFGSPVALNTGAIPALSTMCLDSGTTPSAVMFNGVAYIFWVNNSTILFNTCVNSTWGATAKLGDFCPGVNTAANTSPSAVVFQNSLFVFYTAPDSNGNLSVSYAFYDGTSWTSNPTSIGVITGCSSLPGTSPAAAVYNNSLYVFWNGSGNDGIWFSTTTASTPWTEQVNTAAQTAGISVAAPTSPCAFSSEYALYMLFNGSGNNGQWFTQYLGETEQWTKGVCSVWALSNRNVNTTFTVGTSPAAVPAANGLSYSLFWICGTAPVTEIYYAQYSQSGWSYEQSLTSASATPSVFLDSGNMINLIFIKTNDQSAASNNKIGVYWMTQTS